MRFSSLCCSIGGGLLAFVLAVTDLTFWNASDGALWLLAAGVIGIFAGGIVEDATVPAAALMAASAAGALASIFGVGLQGLLPAMVLALGAFLAWSAETHPPRVHRDTRVPPRLPTHTREPKSYGDSDVVFERLDRLMRMADDSRRARSEPIRRRHSRPRVY